MRLLLARLLPALLLTAFLTPALDAKPSDWTDLQGTRFRGEPTEILGPFALFRTGPRTGRRMLLRGLPPAECQRLYRELAATPPRAAQWSNARGRVSRDVIGYVSRVVNKQFVPADLSVVPEPAVIIAVYGSHNDGESWTMLSNVTPLLTRLERAYPGQFATVFFGVRHTSIQHQRIAEAMPWLVANFATQESIASLARFAPGEGTFLVALSREGVPLLSARATDLAATQKFADDLIELAWLLNPANPRTWKDRGYYLGHTRPLEFARTSTPPFLVGDPLRPAGLRQRGISRIAARITVGADGAPTEVDLLPGSVVPEKFAPAIADSLRRNAVFLPAIDAGTAVAGTYDYTLEIPPENPAATADLAWLSDAARTNLPITEWLVLKPIKVSEEDFGGVERVDESGKVIMKSFDVTDSGVSRRSQMSAFNTDWFSPADVAGLHPVAGATQQVGGETLTWKRIVPVDGYVEFQTAAGRIDYCIGYAWTEFESPADLDAWLGIGSDDGLKIWFNGELVNDKWVRRQSRLDDDVVHLRLKKGKNHLLIKIQNAIGEWSFVSRLRIAG